MLGLGLIHGRGAGPWCSAGGSDPTSDRDETPASYLNASPGEDRCFLLRCYRKPKKRGKDMEKLRTVIETLCAHERLEPKHRDHAPSGEWQGWRDCHIEPDWILIYREEAGKLELGRSGTHADLLE